MKCEMPNCDNESTKKIKNSGVFYGIYVEDAEIDVCDQHPITDIQNRINEVCVDNCMDSQLCNPFDDMEMLRKQKIMSK
jgi:hypothetical protein